MVIVKSECLVKLHDQVDDADDLAFDLFGCAEDMGIVLGKLPDPYKSVHLAGKTDAQKTLRFDTRLFNRLTDRPDGSLPPVRRILFVPARTGRVEWISCFGLGQDLAL